MSGWVCPRCERRFGAPGRSHVCMPAMSFDDYFETRPPIDRATFDAVVEALGDVDGVEVEAVSVGVLFRARRTFLDEVQDLIGRHRELFIRAFHDTLAHRFPGTLDEAIERNRREGGAQ